MVNLSTISHAKACALIFVSAMMGGDQGWPGTRMRPLESRWFSSCAAQLVVRDSFEAGILVDEHGGPRVGASTVANLQNQRVIRNVQAVR